MIRLSEVIFDPCYSGLLQEDTTEGEEKVETRVLKGCVRIGDLSNGLLLKDDKSLEMLVFCTDKPTLYMLQNVKAKFEELLTVSVWCVTCGDVRGRA